MASVTLLLDAAAVAVSVVAYTLVARAVLDVAPAEPAARRARALFATWWGAIALTGAATVATSAMAAFDLLDRDLHVTFLLLKITLLAIGLFGLVHYLVYLFTGSERGLLSLAIVYLLFYVLTLAAIFDARPSAVVAARWSVEVVYAEPMAPLAVGLILGFLVFPQMLGAIAYGAVAHRVDDPRVRYRVLAVSGGIIAWSVSTFLSGAHVRPDDDVVQVGLRILSIVGIYANLAAYRPPAWVERRLAAAAGA